MKKVYIPGVSGKLVLEASAIVSRAAPTAAVGHAA